MLYLTLPLYYVATTHGVVIPTYMVCASTGDMYMYYVLYAYHT